MYRGGMLELARSCFAKHSYCMDNARVRGNVFLNDVFVFSLLVQADAHNDTFFRFGLKQGDIMSTYTIHEYFISC